MGQQRLLIISASGELPAWDLTDFSCERAPTIDAGLASLAARPFDAVVVAARGEQVRLGELCAKAQEILGEDTLPMLLAAHGADEPATRGLEALPFDGFIDLGWSPALAQRYLKAALVRVRAGRNLVHIQQHILEAAKGDVSSLQELAIHDELTGLFNLRYFREVMAKEHQRAQRHKRPYGLVYLDLDDLKAVNTAFGHAAGSRALVAVGAALGRMTRQCDYAFRIGGDEFVALVVECSATQAAIYAERACRAVEALGHQEGDAAVRLTVSAGVAAFPDDGTAAEQVMQRADQALFRAKHQGKNRVACFVAEAGGLAR